ncbi:hypothetical protein H2198_005709 [Neophaeococcomyces mojaviensis]|uniref:Uncharacterized protein n=1 Tax=Neophaeococcomyces mojaviensis TaxID=3383035 RepID=A0ACC3A4U7_9EURO|nr:hypothetical protein H2198_005709 [Knufia sp. JES_112]
MNEKETETIVIKDVDEDIDDETLMRFIEFAYTGDYTTPEPCLRPLPAVKADDHVCKWETFAKGSKKDKKRKTEAIMYNEEPCEEPCEVPCEEEDVACDCQPPCSLSISIGAETSRSRIWENFRKQACIIERTPWKPRIEKSPSYDYSRVFLSHARLYKFSDRYDCTNLMALTLQKLRLTLSKHCLYRERIEDIVGLLRYTYRHTMDLENGQDRLRDVVLDYILCYIKELMKDAYFRKLFNETEMKTFSEDIVVRMMQVVT